MILFTLGAKLVLTGGIVFVIALIAYTQPWLGFEEQSMVSWLMMATFIVWTIGGIYLGTDGDRLLTSSGPKLNLK